MKMKILGAFRKLVVMALVASIAGCASQIMQNYVGKSVTEAMLDYGPPTAVIDLPDETRAFQWKIDSSGVVPISNPTTTNIHGAGGWVTATSTTTTYMPFSQTCNYTLLTKPSGDDWIVVGFRQPSLECE